MIFRDEQNKNTIIIQQTCVRLYQRKTHTIYNVKQIVIFYHTRVKLHDDEMEEWTSNTKIRVREWNIQTTDVNWIDDKKRRRDLVWMSGLKLYTIICYVIINIQACLLVLRFGRAWQRGQEFQGFLDLDWDWWWSGQMVSDRSVTVLVGDVTSGDDWTVRSHVRAGSLDHGNRSARWSGLQVTDFFLFDSVFGLEPA